MFFIIVFYIKADNFKYYLNNHNKGKSMSDENTTEEFTNKQDTICDNQIEIAGIPISEMAEMISIFFDEINSVAKNLEKTDSPMPKTDLTNLLNSLLEYAKTGSELAATFNEKVEKFAIAKESYLNKI